MQSHGVRRLRFRVLLAVQEGDNRPSLFESFRLHVLGHEAVVTKEETVVAARYSRRRACHDCFSRWNCCSRHDYR